ncbi:MAG: Crp/Fnr family transcriptional regulator [Bacteroidales bacterium]
MEQHLTKTNCINCKASPDCFIQQIKNTNNFKQDKKTQITYNKGETLIKEGNPVTNVLYIIQGLVKVYIEGPEKNIIIKILTPKDFIGLTALFGGETYYFSAAALTGTRVCLIERQSIRMLMDQCCNFSRELAKWYCESYNLMLTKCLNLGLRQLNGKLANVLLYLSGPEFANTDVFAHISRKELGELSGMSMESVVRILSEFKQEGIVEMKGRKITVKNYNRLKELNKKG